MKRRPVKKIDGVNGIEGNIYIDNVYSKKEIDTMQKVEIALIIVLNILFIAMAIAQFTMK